MSGRKSVCPAKWRTKELTAVWCHLEAGHQGEHESTVTITWTEEDTA